MLRMTLLGGDTNPVLDSLIAMTPAGPAAGPIINAMGPTAGGSADNIYGGMSPTGVSQPQNSNSWGTLWTGITPAAYQGETSAPTPEATKAAKTKKTMIGVGLGFAAVGLIAIFMNAKSPAMPRRRAYGR